MELPVPGQLEEEPGTLRLFQVADDPYSRLQDEMYNYIGNASPLSLELKFAILDLKYVIAVLQTFIMLL